MKPAPPVTSTVNEDIAVPPKRRRAAAWGKRWLTGPAAREEVAGEGGRHPSGALSGPGHPHGVDTPDRGGQCERADTDQRQQGQGPRPQRVSRRDPAVHDCTHVLAEDNGEENGEQGRFE